MHILQQKTNTVMHHWALQPYVKEYTISNLKIDHFTANKTFIHKTGTATHLDTVEQTEGFYSRQDFIYGEKLHWQQM